MIAAETSRRVTLMVLRLLVVIVIALVSAIGVNLGLLVNLGLFGVVSPFSFLIAVPPGVGTAALLPLALVSWPPRTPWGALFGVIASAIYLVWVVVLSWSMRVELSPTIAVEAIVLALFCGGATYAMALGRQGRWTGALITVATIALLSACYSALDGQFLSLVVLWLLIAVAAIAGVVVVRARARRQRR